jgi:predicted RNA binding protein YcfA (HicA-like mRNA interferase family)
VKSLPFREVKRKLLKAGFVVVNQIGSHIKFAITAKLQKEFSDL